MSAAKTVGQVLQGKVALVTGGSRGIGAAISRDLAAAGATVLLNYARSADAAEKVAADIRAAGGSAHVLQCDVADAAQVKSLFQKIDRDFGGTVDVLVNNAGVYKQAPLAELTEEDYDAVYDTNVRAAFLVTKEAARRMRSGGRIITIGSVLSERALGPGMTLYASSKFAVSGMTRAWALEFAAQGITANVVEPGPIDTDMNPADPAVNPAANQMVQMIPAKRYGRATEVSAVVTFLASPAAAFVNGATITVDGGVLA